MRFVRPLTLLEAFDLAKEFEARVTDNRVEREGFNRTFKEKDLIAPSPKQTL